MVLILGKVNISCKKKMSKTQNQNFCNNDLKNLRTKERLLIEHDRIRTK
jgi:hypothetical protein